MKNLLFRLRLAWEIATNKHKHIIVVTLTETDFIKLLSGEEHDGVMYQYRMHSYLTYSILKELAEKPTDVDWVCMRADYEAKVYGEK